MSLDYLLGRVEDPVEAGESPALHELSDPAEYTPPHVSMVTQLSRALDGETGEEKDTPA